MNIVVCNSSMQSRRIIKNLESVPPVYSADIQCSHVFFSFFFRIVFLNTPTADNFVRRTIIQEESKVVDERREE